MCVCREEKQQGIGMDRPTVFSSKTHTKNEEESSSHVCGVVCAFTYWGAGVAVALLANLGALGWCSGLLTRD
jgi:hypothetical protein